jgi:deoxyribodipyrimidine photo-lyase
MQVVWFKRDLRIYDHQPLSNAVKHGLLIPLYILEPQLWRQPDLGTSQYKFLDQSLHELDQSLQKLGQGLIIKVGDAIEVLAALHAKYNIHTIWSHQETWNSWTYTRDKAVMKWLNNHNITWQQIPQHGVVRRLDNRDGWAANWYQQMKQPITPAPTQLTPVPEASAPLPMLEELGLSPDIGVASQQGGRVRALALLDSFLHTRGENYSKEMSSPVSAFASCSRLSPHLSFGTISIKEVFQITEQRVQQIKAMPYQARGKWLSALRSFSGRLRWHCHFIQKLEDEPRIEFSNMHPAYDGLREAEFNESYFQAWQQGKTGYPMIDACMRALINTGWINFRMRAMLMSFASYHLWLHWQRPALYLASLFTDYEPGIHYSQAQMQSGTTGINSIRIYNPLKQSIDQDPEGIFIKQWLPELEGVDSAFIHHPWLVESIINHYPLPIVDERKARKFAADKLYAIRKTATHKQIATKIVDKHGSRKSGIRRRKKSANIKQPELPL